MDSLKVAVIYGSVRSERKGIRAARYMEQQLISRGCQVSFIDPVEFPLPLLDKMYKEYAAGTAPAVLEQLSTILQGADLFVIVTGEYNHSVPPALKNLLDHFQREYFFKPSAIVSYSAGSIAGARAATHLREIMGELGAPSISSVLSFPVVQDTLNESNQLVDEKMTKRVTRFIDEAIWYGEAFRHQRIQGTPY